MPSHSSCYLSLEREREEGWSSDSYLVEIVAR